MSTTKDPVTGEPNELHAGAGAPTQGEVAKSDARVILSANEADAAEKHRNQAIAKVEALRVELATVRAELEHVKLQLTAVVDWDDVVVGRVDAVVKEQSRYKDRLKAIFIDIPEERDRLRDEIADLRGQLTKANGFVVQHGAADSPRFYGDHACAQCHPHSDILKEGFVCAYHAAIAKHQP